MEKVGRSDVWVSHYVLFFPNTKNEKRKYASNKISFEKLNMRKQVLFAYSINALYPAKVCSLCI